MSRDDTKLARWARRYVRERRLAKTLREQFGRMMCGFERTAFNMEYGEPGTSVPPCWKRYAHNGFGDPEDLPMEDWCQSCRDREDVRSAWRKATHSRGAALREMIRLETEANHD